MKDNAVTQIVNAIRAFKSEVKMDLKAADHLNFHPDLHPILGMILYNDALGAIDWSNVSVDLLSEKWALAENLSDKSTNDLRAMMYLHVRNERFSRGHLQNLVASGYLDKWADALEASISSMRVI